MMKVNNSKQLTRPTWLQVDLAAIQNNAKAIMKHAGAQKMIAVVKANAYGHGAVAVTNSLYAIGIRDFAVATIDEGIELRQNITQQDINILLLGVQDVAQVPVMLQYHLTPAIGDIQWLMKATQLMAMDDVLNVHLAVDTGMGRMGARNEHDVQMVKDFIDQSSHFALSGVFTHFATADDHNDAYYQQQVQKFQLWTTHAQIPEELCHLANTGSALWHHNEINTHTIRVGSALYGFNPGIPHLEMPLQLQPAMALKTKIGATHQMAVGESISYGATYTAQQPQLVATLPIGYADGYLRRLQGMKVLVDGHFEKVVGRITMDQILITLKQPYPVGTIVTLMGYDGEQQISVEDIANYAKTIPHEVLTILTSRLPRIY